ncbi:MAG: DNA topoisomerase IV subunit B, partial [Rhodospirillaceae bacterium]
QDIEVLEGLEPVRRRPGMYIGGTDERAMHHLVAEVLDNAMDEAVAGHADWIDLELAADGTVTVRDNGRGIPIDPHPKFKNKSALEVVMTTLHSGGKFSGKVYSTSGGLHGVGISVVNALSDRMSVEVARNKNVWSQEYARGAPTGKLRDLGATGNRRGTTVRFHPDPEIFGAKAAFKPAMLYRLARSKAYLFRGVEIRWSCDPGLVEGSDTPAQATLHFPGGLPDFLAATLEGRPTLTPKPFAGEAKLADQDARLEWAVAWPHDDEPFFSSYCNTVPTAQGGTHEVGLRTGLTRALKAHAELVGNRKAAQITAEDATGGFCAVVSVFIRDPEFQGQTKEKLSTAWVARAVETTIKDHFDHWLADDPEAANVLLERIVARAEDRLQRRQAKEMLRKTPTRRLRLPGKLTDCARDAADGTEIFLVEGDSAGGSAKQARNRETQAILPLRGKILNVASATAEKLRSNQELADLVQALGCGTGTHYDEARLRYERVIIMTDADVDGAHIASLLMTFFYREMPKLVTGGHLFLALPPLYKLTQGSQSAYAMDDAEREKMLREKFTGRGKVEINRFKGLGEMPPHQLKETTMDPAKRTLLRVTVADAAEAAKSGPRSETADLIERLMGRRPELRLEFIQKNAHTVAEVDA